MIESLSIIAEVSFGGGFAIGLAVGIAAGVASGVASYKQRFSRNLKQKIDTGEIQFLDRDGATMKPEQLHQILED
ncbi:MAG: hypothetical protein L7U72_00550 [Rubripirellula sp.]|nr:hypothetical protein [Rubripirellula sp.]